MVSSPDLGEGDYDASTLPGGSSLFLVILIGAAGILIFRLWEFGIKVSPDSITYYHASLSALRGEGLKIGLEESSPYLTQFPPITSLCLAAIQIFRKGISAFLVLNSIALSLNVLLVFFVARSIFGSRSLSFAIAVCFLIHPITFSIHRSGLSEPLYLVFTLFTLYAVSKKMNIRASVSAALSILTRYAGGHFLIFFPALSLLPIGKNMTLRSVGTLMLAPFVALVLWIARNAVLAGNLTGRSGVLEQVDFSVLLLTLTQTVSKDWAFGEQFPAPGLLAAALLIFPLLGFLQKKTAILSLAYLTSFILIIVSRLYLDAEVPLNDRILFVPFVLALMIIIGIPGSILVGGFGKSFLTGSIGFVILGYGVFHPPEAPEPSAFESSSWEQSTGLQFLEKQVDKGATIYTNGQDFVALYSGLSVQVLPARYNAGSREELVDSLEVFRQQLEDSKTTQPYVVFAFFDKVTWRWYLWNEETLVKELNLELVEETSDARFYTLPKKEVSSDDPKQEATED